MIDPRRPKVRHLIGAHRDSPIYPEAEDIEYTVLKWYHLDGGKSFIHDERRLDVTGYPIVDDKTLSELLGPGILEASLQGFIDSGLLRVHKSTNFTRYFELAKSETYAMAT